MWLDNLKELKKAKGMTNKQIAELTNLPDKTVIRIFSGETDNPYVDTLHRIVSVLGGSLDNILSDTKAVVGNKDLATLEEEFDALTIQLSNLQAENSILTEQADALTTENATLKTEKIDLETIVASLTAERDILKLKLEHKEELLALHNYYTKFKSSND